MKEETLSDEYLVGWSDGKKEMKILANHRFKDFIKKLKEDGCGEKYREFTNGARGYMNYTLICGVDGLCPTCTEFNKKLKRIIKREAGDNLITGEKTNA